MNQKSNALRTLILGGILPVVSFTVIEETYGTLAGLIAGMVFGVGEILYEYSRYRKVETITLVGNGLLLVMGAVSLFTQDGIWFKLQPALIEVGMAVFLVASVVMKRPLLLMLAEKQGTLETLPPGALPVFVKGFTGITLRIGIFFFLHSILATYAAMYWSTRAWAILKGVGFTASLFVYMICEMVLLRKKIKAAVITRESEARPT